MIFSWNIYQENKYFEQQVVATERKKKEKDPNFFHKFNYWNILNLPLKKFSVEKFPRITFNHLGSISSTLYVQLLRS